MDIKFIFAIVSSFASLCVTIGVYMTKIKNLEKSIERIEKRQDENEDILSKINSQLTELNTKMNLLLHGQINIKENV